VIVPPAECHAHVGFDRDLTLPGYYVPTRLGSGNLRTLYRDCSAAAAKYKGDFYVDEFTDAKLRAQWNQCELDEACYGKVQRSSAAGPRPTRIPAPIGADTYLLGKIDADNPNVDLKTIRRPAFFSRAPYHESIAQDDDHTFIVNSRRLRAL